MELGTTGDIAIQDQVAYTLPVGLGYRSAWEQSYMGTICGRGSAPETHNLRLQ
jgi:hypothetical protein